MPHSDEISLLAGWISSVRSGNLPDRLYEARRLVAEQYREFAGIIQGKSPPQIYGVNTLPGHREGEPMPAGYATSYQRDLIENHCLPQTCFVEAETARFIHFAKCMTLSAGGALVSPDLYELLLDLAADREFEPAIPAGASYSSGDVIPAAYWARAVLDRRPDYELMPGEGMALINGAFIHLGTALSAFSCLEAVWDAFLETTRSFLFHVPAGDALLSQTSSPRIDAALRHVTAASRYPVSGELQLPVACRAIPQSLSAFHTAIACLAKELSDSLRTSSSNPLIGSTIDGETRILPSGSFVAPGLALATGQMIDAALMIGWTIVRRMEYFLSGDVDGIARDGTGPTDPIGLIQWPKLAAARLEHMRMLHSRRVFASGGATSYGIEDFWTHGTITARQLSECLETLLEILELERAVHRRAGRKMLDAKQEIPASARLSGIPAE